jgi:hypothetical protein
MSVNRWKLISMPVVMLGLASPLLMNCSGGGIPGVKLPGGLEDAAGALKGCDSMKDGDFTKLAIKGGGAAELKIKGFLNASFGLQKAVGDMRVELTSACADLAKGLGVPEAEIKDEDPDKATEKACNAAAAKVSATMKAGASGQITVEIDPPKCYVPIDAMTKCLDACGSPIKGGKLEASCKGGEIAGKCDAECKGSCSADVGAECKGTCKAACQGKCDINFKGTCGGKCDGKCEGKASAGAKCDGTCEGKCDAGASGTCGGTCEGKCSGSCEMKAKAKCEGTCSGGCSAELKAPKCTGEFEPPSVDPSCQLQCTAKTAADIHCAPPDVRIVAKGKASADLNKFVTALQISIPRIAKIQLGSAKRIGTIVAGVVKAGADVTSVATSAGGEAIACVAAGVKASAAASVSIDVNVKASASVGGSVGAKGGG